MKLICLNLWGGRILEPLLDFLKTNNDVDIFCFQEIYHNAEDSYADLPLDPSLTLLTDMQKVLPDYTAFYRPVIKRDYGIGMLIKNGIEVTEEGDIFIFENPNFVRGGVTIETCNGRR